MVAKGKLIIWAAFFLLKVFGHPSERKNNSFVTIKMGNNDSSNAVSEADGTDYRLPTEIISLSSYNIVIKPDFHNNGEVITFTGEVVISGYYLANVKRLTLHVGNNIRIYSLGIKYSSGNPIQILSTERDAEREFLHINYNGNQFTTFFLTIAYTATFSGEMDGFYKTFYKIGDEHRFLFVTHFEPTMARKVFPCFDEPSFKATFTLTVYAPQGYGALSCTPLDKVVSVSGTSETKKFVFERTPKMSPHAFGFMLYDAGSYGPTAFGAITRSEASVFSWARTRDVDAGLLEYTLAAGARALDALEKYTDCPFRGANHNVSKVDLAVLPNFQAHGRPNWGLLSYRSDLLLISSQESTEAEKDRAEQTIAYALAHQWFGNLVSPAWWDEAWLSAGVSTYLRYRVASAARPLRRLMERAVVEQQHSALVADARPAAHALHRRANTPREVAAKLHGLSGSKGVSIMLMLSNMMGEVTLRNSLRSFVSSKKYEAASVSNLVTALQNNRPGNISFNMKDFVSSWTENPGYPLITVTRDYATGTATIKQRRFAFVQSAVENVEYMVPLLLKHGNRHDRYVLLPNASIDLEGLSADRYALLTEAGYYRVAYDERNWALLAQQLKSQSELSSAEQIDPVDRARLVDDALNLARGGALPYEAALRLVECLSGEADYLPWRAAFPGIHFLKRMLVNVDSLAALKAFMLHILGGVYAQLGHSPSGPHLEQLLRADVLREACAAGDPRCLREASAAFRAFLDQGTRPNPNIREVILCFGVQEGSDTDWNKVLNILVTSEIESERAAVIQALGCSKDSDTLGRYLDTILNAEYIQSSERRSIFTAIYSNPLGVDIVLDRLVRNFNLYMEEFGERIVADIVTELAEYLVTSEQATKIRNLAAGHPELSDALNSAWNVADGNAFWVINNGRIVVEALEAVTPVRETTSSTSVTFTYPEISTNSSSFSTPSSTYSTPSTYSTLDSSTFTSFTDETTSITTTESSSIDDKNFLGLIITVLVIFFVWVVSYVIMIRRYKKII